MLVEGDDDLDIPYVFGSGAVDLALVNATAHLNFGLGSLHHTGVHHDRLRPWTHRTSLAAIERQVMVLGPSHTGNGGNAGYLIFHLSLSTLSGYYYQ